MVSDCRAQQYEDLHVIVRLMVCSGPIVRINPDELHCSDVSFADEIYAVSGRKRDKPVHQINGSA